MNDAAPARPLRAPPYAAKPEQYNKPGWVRFTSAIGVNPVVQPQGFTPDQDRKWVSFMSALTLDAVVGAVESELVDQIWQIAVACGAARLGPR